MKSTFKWLFDAKDWKLMLRSVPSLIVTLFCVSVVVMNLMASKTIIITDPAWFGVTGGILLSWIPFLCMDILNKSYGPRVATKINILALGINLFCVGIFELVSRFQIGGNPEFYTAFNSTFKQTWQILTASSIAFLVSGIFNNVLNAGIAKLFKNSSNDKKEYYARSYGSTIIAQFIDNFVFTSLAFLVFFKLSLGSSFGWTWWTVLGSATFNAILELVMEVIFSPFGYKVCKKWEKENVGKEYLDYVEASKISA